MKTIFKLLCIPCIFCLMSFQYNWDSEDYEFTYVLDNFQDSYIICNVICSMEHTIKPEHIEIIIQDCVEELKKHYDMTMWLSEQNYVAKGHLESEIYEKVKKQYPSLNFKIDRISFLHVFI